MSRGPYGWVRHPAYAAFTAMLLGAGLGLGSWISLALVPVITGLFVLRTLIEDRMLRAELPGYEEYAHRVRFRLVPGIW